MLYIALVLQKFEDNDVIKNDPSQERCFLSHNDTPYFYLSPLKLEVVMEKPIEIYIYHDVVTSNELNTIKNVANLRVSINSILSSKY